VNYFPEYISHPSNKHYLIVFKNIIYVGTSPALKTATELQGQALANHTRYERWTANLNNVDGNSLSKEDQKTY
jgi:hypothetical protein